jgi:hypothetical protein
MEQRHHLSTQVPVALAEDFRRLCDETERSMSQELRRLVRIRVAAADREKDAKATTT